MYRCDGCYERRQRGEEPVCVLACPVNCLRFAARDQREEVCP
ncbi:4Fe-4S dicluster domain-containing protein [Enterocloster lavalensis]